ncbi:VanZ family protein [Streptomyces gilvosporeus]|uniref:VanZ family protein n=1 Tax=Streptomyces gilvosporeus TaxID=553510 RepID=A0A1V0TRN8_9ACTN|nr:VanZ family protein [Streptomyces gilvosporeus]ARF55616.1 VanZ family protein [Streptomyces gilvosporeus]
MWQAALLALSPATLALFLTAMAALALSLAAWAARAPATTAPRITAAALLAAWLLLLLLVTLAPTQPVGSADATVWWRPGESLFGPGAAPQPQELSMLLRQHTALAALYVPGALLLRFAAPRWSAAGAFLFGVGLCVLLETAQLLMRAGRIADIDDVLCAAAGTATGAALGLLAHLAATRLRPRPLTRRPDGPPAADAPTSARG